MPDVIVSAESHGRVNLIGEHTDYHEGFVLPTLIPQRTRVALVRRADVRVVASSTLLGDRQEYELGCERAGRGWLDYVQGVTAMVARAGMALGGFEAVIESSIPMGAGVSSSAALEVALLRGLRQMFGLDIDDVALARLARSAESDFVGAPVGVMDQVVCSLGRESEALFIDTRSLGVERVPLPPALELIVIDSGVTHAHADGAYGIRRTESFAAAEQLGVRWLRDADTSWLPRIEKLPPPLAARARHVVTENARVLRAVDALKRHDSPALGALFNASHASMRDDYAVSTPSIDTLVAIGQRHRDVYGARLTGGGFGGSVVMLTGAGRSREVSAAICTAYRAQTGEDGVVLVPQK